MMKTLSRVEVEGGRPLRDGEYRSPPPTPLFVVLLSTVSPSVVSVTCAQPQHGNNTWKHPEINNLYVLSHAIPLRRAQDTSRLFVRRVHITCTARLLVT